MNKMKKILACALALCMALALVACSGGNNTANNGGESNTPPANSGETNNTAEGGETTEDREQQAHRRYRVPGGPVLQAAVRRLSGRR